MDGPAQAAVAPAGAACRRCRERGARTTTPQRSILFLAYHYPPVRSGGVERTVKFQRYLPDFGYRARILTTSAFGPAGDAVGPWAQDVEQAWEPVGLYRRLAHRRRAGGPPPVDVVLCMCLLKGKGFDLVVEKAVEVGVTRIVPVLSERTISRPADAAARVGRGVAASSSWQRARTERNGMPCSSSYRSPRRNQNANPPLL